MFLRESYYFLTKYLIIISMVGYEMNYIQPTAQINRHKHKIVHTLAFGRTNEIKNESFKEECNLSSLTRILVIAH